MKVGRCTLTLAMALSAAALLSFPLAAPASAGGCRGAKATPTSISTKQAGKAVVCLLNKRRHAHGLGSLNSNGDLRKASLSHSQYMVRHHCFDHECPGESSVQSRLQIARYLVPGLTSWLYAENIAYGTRGSATPAAVVRAWMHSAGHRANILSSSFRDLGVGVSWGTLSSRRGDGGFYTTDFGYRR